MPLISLVALALSWIPVSAQSLLPLIPMGAAHEGTPAGDPVVLAQAKPAEGTTVTTTTKTYGDWTVSCRESGETPQRTCSAEFRAISQQNNNATVLIWLLGRDAEGKLLAEFVTPSDILIKPGVTVAIDGGKSTVAEFISCTNNQGCRASMELTPKLARELKQASKATVGLTLLNGQVMQVSMEISGVEQALTDLGS